jgi:hypothetical protein
LTYEKINPMGKPSTHQTKDRKMAKEKAVKEAVKINSNISTAYALLIESGENNNMDAINFILEVGNEMANGTTTREVKESMKQALNGVNVKPVVLPNHVDSLLVACLIIARFNDEMANIKASKVLSLAVRVMADKKASGAKKHIESAKSFDELDEQTLTKKESQTRDGSTRAKAEVAKSAKDITIESVVDSLATYLSSLSLKDIKTTEPKKLDEVIGKLITISKNSKVAEKVNA